MPESVPEFRMHQPDLAAERLVRRLAQVRMQRFQQRLFVPLDGVLQLAQPRPAKRERTRRPGLEEGALPLDGGGKVHNRLGESSALAYHFVKHA